MSASQPVRRYIILRPAQGHAAGFARLEGQHGRGRMAIHAQQVAGKATALRALLLSGDEQTGAVLDLGLMPLDGRRQGHLQCVHLPLSRMGTQGGYHTLVLTGDWPDPKLQLYGWLTEQPQCTLWQMQQAAARYLSLPARDSAPSPAEAPPPPPADKSVLALQPLRWPEQWTDLQPYFDSLPPCSPFDMPGWRFVSSPLAQPAPAQRCNIGIHHSGHRVDQVLYALPGAYAAHPPRGLEDYTWQQGRADTGYWVLHQAVEA